MLVRILFGWNNNFLFRIFLYLRLYNCYCIVGGAKKNDKIIEYFLLSSLTTEKRFDKNAKKKFKKLFFSYFFFL